MLARVLDKYLRFFKKTLVKWLIPRVKATVAKSGKCSSVVFLIKLYNYRIINGFLLKYFPNNFAQKQPPEVFHKKRCSYKFR